MSAIFKYLYLSADILRLILQIFYHICKSVYHKLIGVKEKNVSDDIVLITGTGHGIGKELAIQYALLGTTVVCLDINQESNEDTANEIRKIVKKEKKNIVYTYQCDVSNRKEVFQVAQKINREVGDVTILINNAGIMPCHTFLDYTANDIIQMFNINIIAHMWMLQAFLPSMIKNNYGHIVAISSIAGLTGLPNVVPYSASKYAVAGFMDALSSELAQNSQGKSLIKFTTIYPFMVDTGLCKNPKLNNRFLFRLLSPKNVAAKIINAQQNNIKEMSIPSFWIYLIQISKLLPENSDEYIRKFFNCGLEPEVKD